MKRLLIIAAASMALFSCAPVLQRGLMEQGIREASLSHLREAPDAYKGKLFILGGVIVETRFIANGSQIEALFVPVNTYGYLRDAEHAGGRFLAFYPKTKGLLDPLIYKKGREITLAGEFIELRPGKIDELEYTYPVFEIRQIYLWEERRDYYYMPYYRYPYPYLYPWCHDPWNRPYPCPPYWGW